MGKVRAMVLSAEGAVTRTEREVESEETPGAAYGAWLGSHY